MPVLSLKLLFRSLRAHRAHSQPAWGLWDLIVFQSVQCRQGWLLMEKVLQVLEELGGGEVPAESAGWSFGAHQTSQIQFGCKHRGQA